MSAARLAARVVELLGPVEGGVLVTAAPCLGAALASRLPAANGDAAGGAVVSFLGARALPAERQAALSGLRARLPPGAPLLVVDHNQPRDAWRRALSVFALLAAGLGPARAHYPVARELAAAGFRVERLRFACGERVQLVLARRMLATSEAGEPGR